MNLRFVICSLLALIAPAAAAADINYSNCLRGDATCKIESLTPEQGRAVDAARSGRNFAQCVQSDDGCDFALLTNEQKVQLPSVRAGVIETRKETAKQIGLNISNCAYELPGCDPRTLSPAQRAAVDATRAERAGGVAGPSGCGTGGVPCETSPAIEDVTAKSKVAAAQEASARRRATAKKVGMTALRILAAAAEGYVQYEAERAAYAAQAPVIVSSSARVINVGDGRVVVSQPQWNTYASASELECVSDAQCGAGRKCVKPKGGIDVYGTCVQPVDEFGQQIYVPSSSFGPTEVPGCSFTPDCAIGFECQKKPGQIEGLCIKR